MTSTLATDFSYSDKEQEKGFGRDVFLNIDVGKDKSRSFRNKWLWTPDDKTQVRLTLSFSGTDDGLGRTRAVYPGTVNAFGYASLPGYYDTQESYYGAVNAPGDFNGKDSATRDFMYSLRIDHDFDFIKIVSITGYMDQKDFFTVDGEYSPVPSINANLPIYNKQFSQEFQFISNTTGPFSWIGGLYYLDDTPRYVPFSIIGTGLGPLGEIDVYDQVKQTSIAGFAEASYAFTNTTKLTIGLRDTRDKKTLSGTTYFGLSSNVNRPSASYEGSKSWTKPTWRAVLQQDIAEGSMVYASLSRGFKSGAFNTTVTSGVPDKPVNPETVDAYEVGFKGEFLDRRASITAAAFYYNYKDIQLQQSNQAVQTFFNAANSKIKGGEFDASFLVGEGFTLRAGGAYTDARFTKFPGGPIDTPNVDPLTGQLSGGYTVTYGNLAGNRIPRTPTFSGDVAIDHKLSTDFGAFDTNVVYYYNSGFYWEVDNHFKQNAYGTLGANVRWTAPNDRVAIQAWGKNLTGKEYALYGVGEATGYSYSPAPPRTYGVSISYNFK